MEIHFFDSHAHLSIPEVLPHIEPIMTRATQAGVTKVLNICTDPASLKEGLRLEKQFSGLKNAGATTPHDVEKEGEEAFPIFAEAARQKKLVAVGETGLEYYYKELDRPTQKRFLIRYLHLAQECKLPVIFHCREAFDDLFAITDLEYGKGLPAILHCFTGTLAEAEGVIARGWHL
jgi:TatD DNase family protein